MDISALIYNPLHVWALWLSAWTLGKASSDDTLEALDSAGAHEFDGGSTLELLAWVRAHSDPTFVPPLHVSLQGPGDPAVLPALFPQLLPDALGGAVVLPSPGRFAVLAPRRTPEGFAWVGEVIETPIPLIPPASPGEADLVLADATRAAAERIESFDTTIASLPNPRLTVGTLTDYYDIAGLPAGTPPRSEKLLARADRVAATIEAVLTRAGDHSLDPQLLGLTRQIRAARESAVAYAIAEYQR